VVCGEKLKLSSELEGSKEGNGMSKSNLALTDEEIEQERENYAIESRKIWAKNVSRARKLELSSKLKPCSERIADAQLDKVLTEITKILDGKVREDVAEMIWRQQGSTGDFVWRINNVRQYFEQADQIITLIKKATKEG